ncbi:MAG TPA: hypothetical protein VLH09_07545 [Bryobacteraceae bacterium]|nr:hypothetical protein [Bryobacteraceae bacterium]
MEPEQESPQPLDTSDDLDLVTLFESSEISAQMEAQLIRGVLDAGAVPAVIVGHSTLPNLPTEVRVPKAYLEEALRLIAESQAAGPRGAEEAEQAAEGSGQTPAV